MLRWQVAAGLIYGQVKKIYRRRKLVRVSHVMRLGTQADFSKALQGMGLGGAAEHRFYRASQSDGPPWNSRVGSSYLGDGEACSTPARPSGVVARLLSIRASPCSSASGTGPTTSTRGQPASSTLPTANSGDGSRQNPSTLDRARGALSPLAKGFRLRGIEAREGWLYHIVERWLKVSAQRSEGASRWEEKAYLDCPITKNPPEVGLARAD